MGAPRSAGGGAGGPQGRPVGVFLSPAKSPGFPPGSGTSVGTVRPVLAGRDRERAAIAALLDATRSGTGAGLVLRGVAGSGKSALLADALDAAEGMTVLRTSGVESEAPLAFAALQRLLWPLRSRIDALPAPQRAALRAAMGEAEGDGDRFLVFLGTLSVLADAAADTPGPPPPRPRRRPALAGRRIGGCTAFHRSSAARGTGRVGLRRPRRRRPPL